MVSGCRLQALLQIIICLIQCLLHCETYSGISPYHILAVVELQSVLLYHNPANTKHLYNIYAMLDQCEDVGPTLYKCYRNVLCLLGIMWVDRMRKYKRCSFSVRYGKMQHTSNERDFRLKAHILFIGRVLFFPISHSNEHRFHIISHSVPLFSLWDVYRYQPISHSECSLHYDTYIGIRQYRTWMW